MKYLIFFLIILNILNYVKSDCFQTHIIETQTSCGNMPSRFIINESIYSFESIEVQPYVEPIFNPFGQSYFWNLIDGINYTISYRNKNCSNYIVQSFLPNGMYYELLSEPLCLNTYTQIKVYNWGSNGEDYYFEMVPSKTSINSQNGNCNIQFFILPKSYSKGALQSGDITYKNPTCGFNNGSIQINIKNYSDYSLYDDMDFGFENPIPLSQSPSPLIFAIWSDLENKGYNLLIKSEECGTELISISLENILPSLEINLENVPDFSYDSTISLSFPSGNNGVLNYTNVIGYVSDTEDLISGWIHGKQLPIEYRTPYGYLYNEDFSIDPKKVKCQFSDSMNFYYYYENFNFTIKKSDSCLVNVTITFYPLPTQDIQVYDYDIEGSDPFPLVNNVLSVENNKNLYIFDGIQEKGIVFSTIFSETPSYSIIESSNGQKGCWKTFNITIANYQIYKNLKIKTYNDNGDEWYYYPVNGIFINVPANYFYVYYTIGDCETDSFFIIDKSERSTPMDDVIVDFTTITIGNCTSDTVFKVTVHTIFGTFSEIHHTAYDTDLTFYIPNTGCSFDFSYSSPPLIDTHSFSYQSLTNQNCNSTGGDVVKFLSSSGYTVIGAYVNGIPMVYNNVYNGFDINYGDNNVTIQLSGINGACFKSQMVTISKPTNSESIPIVEITPVTDCINANGKIEISNYQDFQNLEIQINSNTFPIHSGIFENLESGIVTILYSYNQTILCSNSISLFIPSSENNVKITTSIISNPTCKPFNTNSMNSDGKINVTLTINGIQQSTMDFNVQNQNPNFIFGGGIYPIANVGLNNLTIYFGSCKWKRQVIITEINKPKFTFERVFNDTCSNPAIYKLTSDTPNLLIDDVQMSDSFYYQYNYYKIYLGSITESFNIFWNSYCFDMFTQTITIDNYFNNKNNLQYEIIKADNCSSLKIDLLIKNSNQFNHILINKVSSTPINSTHSIFKNLPPTNSFQVSYVTKDGCYGDETVGELELRSGNTKETIDIIKTNDLCYSGKGSVQLLNLNFKDHYYYIKNVNGLMGVDISLTPLQSDGSSNSKLFSNLYPGTFNLTRHCKSMVNCFLETEITIESDTPIIESIQIIDSYGQLNNGSVEIKLNYNSLSPINYQIIGTNLLNQNGKFLNLSPNTYQIQVTLTDRMCPITLSQSFTIKSIIPPPTSQPPPTSSPPKPSDELSTSSIIQFNFNLLITILISIIFIIL
ncbi:hypothetical protein ACTA71_011301 [Dictyostelium dimigraforme]